MAHRAIGRESRSGMIGISRAIVSRQVASHARGRTQCVVVVDVALIAGCSQVCAREREARLGVIERGRLPGDRRVTGFAGCRESGSDVVRIRCLVEIRKMASGARRRQ